MIRIVMPFLPNHTHMHTLIHNANKQHSYMYVITCLYTHTHWPCFG